MMRRFIIAVLTFAITLLTIHGCKKDQVIEQVLPDVSVFNPYDTLQGPDTTNGDPPLDPNSIAGLHKNVFKDGCAQAGCHDGFFEPDFRTVESSYFTLVYAPIVKNNATNDFDYRVVPNDTAASVLYERLTNCCFVNSGDRMPQDSLGILPQEKIDAIAAWIMNGAPDIQGNVSSLPNQEPTTFGVLAYINDTTGLRIDTSRGPRGILNPFEVPVGSTIQICFGLVDDGNNFIAPATFTYNKANFTKSLSSWFNPANEVAMETLLVPWFGPIPFGAGLAPYYRFVTVDTGPGGYNWQVGDVVYFQAIVQDADQGQPTYLFGIDAPIYLKTLYSFEIVP
jgi:hypothetical protein